MYFRRSKKFFQLLRDKIFIFINGYKAIQSHKNIPIKLKYELGMSTMFIYKNIY